MELTIQDLHVLINVSNKEGGSVQECLEEAAAHYKSSRELQVLAARRGCQTSLPVSVCEHGAAVRCLVARRLSVYTR